MGWVESVTWESVVLQESADWVSPWSPPGAKLVDTDRFRFFVDRSVATVVRAEPAEPAEASGAEDLIDEVLGLCRDQGATTVKWTVRPGDVGEAVADSLRRRGGVTDELIDICAWNLGAGLPTIPVPADVEVRPVRDRDDIAALQKVDAEVWGYRELTDREIDEQAANLWPGRFGAFIEGQPVGSAGSTLVTSDRGQSVARMFGAGVVPAFRGRGAYRALLAARLQDARGRGATLALVHARSGTSGPILRKIGFAQVGQQTVIEVRVPAAEEAH